MMRDLELMDNSCLVTWCESEMGEELWGGERRLVPSGLVAEGALAGYVAVGMVLVTHGGSYQQ